MLFHLFSPSPDACVNLWVKYDHLPQLFLPCLPGRGGLQLRRHRLVCFPRPSDLAQRPKVPGGRAFHQNLTPTSSTSSVSSCASSTSVSSNNSLRHPLRRRNPVIPDTIKLPMGIVSQSTGPSQTYTPPGAVNNLVRRRDQPGRRKDSTQSMYIDSPDCDLLLHFSSCPPSASSSSSSISVVTPCPPLHQHEPELSKGQRRYSDADIPYMDDDVWPEQKL